MKNNCNKSFFLCIAFILFICSSFFYKSTSYAKYEDWIELTEMTEVPIVKTFTIKFNKDIKMKDIDGIVIESNGMFIPATMKLKEDEVTVTPVEYLRPNTDYTVRIFLDHTRYYMDFSTEKTENKLIYMGKKDVQSEYDPSKMIEDIHYYRLDFGKGNPIHIYVTDDYDKTYGKGFAYSEIETMITSIEKVKQFKPYINTDSSLDIYFYTNDSNIPFSKETQGKASSWGEHTEILINGSNLPFDFRPVIQHEIVHYFDQQSSLDDSENQKIYEEYWGEDYRFWLLEGSAEYSAFFHHTYADNTINDLNFSLVQNTKRSILQNAKNLSSSYEVVNKNQKLKSFADIKKASDDNYGAALALFWYLEKEYGYEQIYNYVEYIADHFNSKAIQQNEKDKTAIKFFGKTEEQILKDWLAYFDHFR